METSEILREINSHMKNSTEIIKANSRMSLAKVRAEADAIEVIS
jgi:hypothetical protein